VAVGVVLDIRIDLPLYTPGKLAIVKFVVYFQKGVTEVVKDAKTNMH
jgi:hypothetical protein